MKKADIAYWGSAITTPGMVNQMPCRSSGFKERRRSANKCAVRPLRSAHLEISTGAAGLSL
jgi:hypothetical protein